jgi:hypothetical protein
MTNSDQSCSTHSALNSAHENWLKQHSPRNWIKTTVWLLR